MSRHKGFAAEKFAEDFLVAKGLKPVLSNYHSRMGEIDLIMEDGACLVFIEVRSRASDAFGGALASVTYKKQQKLIKTALFYLMKKKLNHNQPMRFDVVSMEGTPPRLNWVQNAFGADF